MLPRNSAAIGFAWVCLTAVVLSPRVFAEDSGFAERVRPVLERHCLGCHGEAKPKGGLNLARFGDEASVLRELKTWAGVLEAVEAGEMPPADKPKPTVQEVASLRDWVRAKLSTARCEAPDPGKVTMRRLNRAEYAHSIRDLLGVPFRATEDFPQDDVGYGFDTIGDVLTLSPILMERYLSAAEDVAGKAIARDLAPPNDRHWEAENLAGDGSHQWDARMLATVGTIRLTFEAPERGDYRVRVRASAQQAGDEPARLGLKVDGRDLATIDVPAVPNQPEIYEATLPFEAGNREVGLSFLNDYYDASHPDPNRRDRNLLIDSVEILGHERERTVLPETLLVRLPTDRADWPEAARVSLERFVSRAYRRPATPEEVARLVGLVEEAGREGDSFAEGLRLAAEAVLVSPHFLYRVEVQRGSGDASRPLDGYELASRLSYFLWGSMPDEELFGQARAGRLNDPAVLEAQARRMLRDARSNSLAEEFAEQWLQVRRLAAHRPDRSRFPKFTDRLRRDMFRETELFFESIVREDRSILEFLDADFTYLNDRLASHYGIDGVNGEEFRRVALTDRRRGGILTQASVLTVTSNPTRTSPVKRGKWILEQVLGAPPPPPPPDAGELRDDDHAQGEASLRQRLEQHRARTECAGCHSKMDPLGFGLENFDAVGAWREKDGDFPVDASGILPSGQSFVGPEALKVVMAERRDEFARCLASKLMTYALGRGLGFDDNCHLDRVVGGLSADGYKFSRLVVGIVSSDAFRLSGRGESR